MENILFEFTKLHYILRRLKPFYPKTSYVVIYFIRQLRQGIMTCFFFRLPRCFELCNRECRNYLNAKGRLCVMDFLSSVFFSWCAWHESVKTFCVYIGGRFFILNNNSLQFVINSRTYSPVLLSLRSVLFFLTYFTYVWKLS